MSTLWGGKACIQKHGCNGNPSSTNVPSTNTAPSSTSVVAVMKHANDVNALEEARYVSKNMDAMAIHLVPMCRLQTLLHQVHRSGCCNEACKRCQRFGGGKACIQKHGCNGNPSSTNVPSTNTVHRVHRWLL